MFVTKNRGQNSYRIVKPARIAMFFLLNPTIKLTVEEIAHKFETTPVQAYRIGLLFAKSGVLLREKIPVDNKGSVYLYSIGPLLENEL